MRIKYTHIRAYNDPDYCKYERGPSYIRLTGVPGVKKVYEKNYKYIFGKPIILSTGMQNINSIRASVEILTEAKVDFALLECTNLYPSPPEIVSLGGILELKTAFPKGREPL